MSLEFPIELHKQVVYGHQTILELLDGNSELSSQQISQCLDNGSVWLETTGKPARIYDPETPLKQGNKLHLYCNESTLSPCPYKPELVQDFESFSIWDKPSGLLSQGSKWGDHWALYRWIQQQVWPERDSFITHRLDRFTQGLMIVAHDKKVNQSFHRLFENRQVQKTYHALVNGLMDKQDDLLEMVTTPIEGKPAETQIKLIERREEANQSLVELKPKTGRKHQIRIHLAELGYPVVNDRQYGQPPFEGDLKLLSSGLEFKHPLTEQKLNIELSKERLLSL